MQEKVISSTAEWIERFGFPVALSILLLVVIVFIVKYFISDMKSLRNEHKEERKEWNNSNSEDRKEMTSALKALELAIARGNK